MTLAKFGMIFWHDWQHRSLLGLLPAIVVNWRNKRKYVKTGVRLP
ncbi:type I toxin-antitoxin system toxin Ldr family protein [Escherichia coli]|nr:type I toxin-antitoxin system toxin Ldr family protein [Escherichia coli]